MKMNWNILKIFILLFLVVFLYGSLVWGTLPMDAKVSWEGHLSGFLVGSFLGLFCFRESIPKKPQFQWEKENYIEDDDPFMRQFDENGNFFELPEELPEEFPEEEKQEFSFKYQFKESDSEE